MSRIIVLRVLEVRASMSVCGVGLGCSVVFDAALARNPPGED